MCGIAVYFNQKGISSKELGQFTNSLQSIKHRGPDGEGVIMINIETGDVKVLATHDTPKGIISDHTLEQYQDGKAHLLIGHRRLSIIDTSIAGHQPMGYKNRYWITFNGEVYNYIEVRSELQKLGYSFKTQSDTEVILAAYDAWKEKALPRFNGMFSIVIFDLLEKTLFVANDRYGVKPLYAYHSGSVLAYVSEIKQFKNHDIDLTINSDVFQTFLGSTYLDYDQQTVYNEVSRFKPAHFSVLNLGSWPVQANQHPYYELDTRQKKININDAKEEFNRLFNNAIKLRLRSDVPLGCSLSGGLDSSAILLRALKSLNGESTHEFNTFSVIFPGLAGDESKFIYALADQLNVKTNYVNALEEFNMEDFERHVYHQDFPVQTTSYYAEWCLAKMVRQKNITVVLNGQGGDELLAGYHHHFYRYCRQLIRSGKVLNYLSLVKKFAELKSLQVNSVHRIILNDVKLSLKFKLHLADLGSSLANNWAKASSLIESLRLDFTEYMLPTYLRSDDRDFMAHHVETRHPFLDFNLVDFCFSLPDELKIREGWQKWLLREALVELPEEIRYRRDKKGYTTPQEVWLQKYKKDFSDYLNYIPVELKDTLSKKDIFLNYALGAWFKVNAKREWHAS